MKHLFRIALIVGVGTACSGQDAPYDLGFPDDRLALSEELNEISGLDLVNDSVLIAVQDEKADVYFLDVQTGSIVDRFDFGKNGDFEGVAHQGTRFYALRSDGRIYICERNQETESYAFKNSKNFDFEGICVDPKRNRLLVACKEHGDKDKRDEFFIYAFSLADLVYEDEIAYKLNKKDVHQNFEPSGIAIHPNGNLYILSSVAKTLLVMQQDGNIIYNLSLNPYIFQQPEGIAFNAKGDLFISNEKQDNVPNVLIFINDED